MKVLKIFIVGLLFVPLIASWFVFFNPFVWGMRGIEYHELPESLNQVENKIRQDSIFVGYGIFDRPTVWYMKDCRRGHLEKLEHFRVNLGLVNENFFQDQEELSRKINRYSVDIIQNIPEKDCFDSLTISYQYMLVKHRYSYGYTFEDEVRKTLSFPIN